jgi:hypothetical protein
MIPVHLFYLKYFEEYELELRLGPSYLEYKQQVPFLVPRWFPCKKHPCGGDDTIEAETGSVTSHSKPT